MWGNEVDGYDAVDDVTKSFEVAYETIRERKAAGGPGWEPRMPANIEPQKNNREEAENLTGSERKAAGRPGFKRPWGNEVDEVSKAAPAPGFRRPYSG